MILFILVKKKGYIVFNIGFECDVYDQWPPVNDNRAPNQDELDFSIPNN